MIPMIDWTISVTAVMQALVLASTVIAVFYGMRNEVRVLRHDVRHVQEQVKQLSQSLSQLGTILTQVAVQDTRLSMIEKSVDELRHGQGYIKTRANEK